MKRAARIDVTVRRAIEFGGVLFQRVGAELLHINRCGGGQPLRAQHIEPGRAAIRIRARRQAVLCTGLVAGDQRRAVADGGVGAGKIRYAGFVGHLRLRWF